MKKYIAYYRVSTQKQGVSGLGLEAQVKAVSSYQPIRSYTEIESGRRGDRPQLLAALADCRRSKAVLVIAKLDRLARNVHFLSGLMESGVEFVCCDMPTANRLTLHIMAAVAEDEAQRISVRTKEALAAYKARGGKLGGAREGAYKVKGGYNEVAVKRLTELAKEAYAELKPLLVKWQGEGVSVRKIAKRLNDEGYKTRRGCKWSARQVSRVMAYA